MFTVMSVRPATSDDQKQWNNLVRHPLQSWAWGEFRKAMGLPVLRLIGEEEKKAREAWQLTFHPLRPLPFSVGYFPKGPMPTEEMEAALKSASAEYRAVSILLEPDVTAEALASGRLPGAFVPAHRPLFTRYTYILDLTKTEDGLLSAMHPKTRYNIRIASRHGVTVREDNSEKAFATYLTLHEETTSRQRFYAHNETYMKSMWRIMHKSGIARLFTAALKEETVAAWIVFVFGNTLYYPYGASSRFHKNVMAPNLLLWELARWGKRNGLSKFDLWGALGPDPDPKDPWYGFHKFKQGFGPDLVEFAGSYELILNNPVHTLYTLADSVRWSYLKAIKRLAG